jgi:aminopeptidase N
MYKDILLMFHYIYSARNRVTAAESRRKSKTEAQSLREEVTRLSGELKSKTELLAEYKEKFQMYENGQSKEEIARVVAQRRAAIAAAAAVVAAAEGNAPSTRVSDLVMSSRPDIPADGETARL